MQKDYKAMAAARRDIAEQAARFTRIDRDINGNPRYYLPKYAIPETHAAYIADALGLSKYRGKKYGAGYVIQSYNIESDALELRGLESLSEYQISALQFLRDTGTNITIQKAVPQRAPRWHKASDGGHGIHYSVTLENKRGAYTFDFWDSVAAKANGTKPAEYDILACLFVSDKDETFSDFCDSFGYDTDSISARDTFNAVQEQSENLRRLFTRGQLQALTDIA
jgi:hypothetical protein